MAKGGKAGGGGVQNKTIYSRVSFLQQASVFLSSATKSSESSSSQPSAPLQGMGRRLATDLRAVSLKTRIRLNPAVKRTICKFCDSALIDGQSCTTTIENRSKGGKKPWADNIVRKCHTCGKERRYPVSAPRTKRKTERVVPDSSTKQD
ncbi:putative ribonuclease P protein subunit p21 [Cladorrhinum sp. PSN332]|nr:putative ribonuclease P protein subunit p21 [Cladorrhinum sp. PSN332]